MIKTAYFAGGCFWCITPVFRLYEGVKSVTSGYSGGEEENPAYEDVKHQRTGHRETIRVEFEDSEVSFDTLLDIYLANVDPFDGEGQFIDKGFSYTLAIFYTDEVQRAAAEARLEALKNGDLSVFPPFTAARLKRLAEERRASASDGKPQPRPCIAIEAFKSFYPAEEYHQDWDLKNPEAFEEEISSSGRGHLNFEI